MPTPESLTDDLCDVYNGVANPVFPVRVVNAPFGPWITGTGCAKFDIVAIKHYADSNKSS